MINKLQKIFQIVTLKSYGQIKDKEHLDHLIQRLKERKILVDHDIPLLHKYIIDFPINFTEICSYIRQIFLLDIEKEIEGKINTLEDTYQKIIRFLHFYSLDALNSEDLKILFQKMNFNLENFKETLKNFRLNQALLQNIRFDTKHFLWEKIAENIPFQNEIDSPDYFITNSIDYQLKMNQIIKYELDIIRTERIQMNPEKTKLIKKIKKIKIEKVFCADRNIPIQSIKVPTSFYDSEILNKILYKCEALKELLLSKHFQKFTGFDDLSSEEYYYYFFENLDGVQLIQLIKKLDLDISENSILFRYISNEILKAMRDMLYKCTYSFEFPIGIENVFYEASQLRLYIDKIDFGPKRKAILESHQIIEAKLLYFYGIILISLLAVSKKELDNLYKEITNICADLSEMEQMLKINDMIGYIEDRLTDYIESDVIIAIIVECLISPFKARILFDEFYEKKNFLKQAVNKRISINLIEEVEDSNNYTFIPQIEKSDNVKKKFDGDKLIAYEPYYDKNEDANDDFMKKTMTINHLLIHPFFRDLKIEDSLLSIMFNK